MSNARVDAISGIQPLSVDAGADSHLVQRDSADRRFVAVLLCGWSLIWVALLVPTSLSAPTDTMEQLIWASSLEWGYYKHPPLPTWLLAAFGELAGRSQLGAALLTALLMSLSFALLADLCRQLAGRHFAWLVLCGALCISWFGPRMLFYNHDVVMQTLYTLTAWALHRAHRTRAWRDWTLVGIALGLGMLTKYQMCLAALAVVLLWAMHGGWREARGWKALGWVVFVSSALFAPHLIWLVKSDFSTFRYAADSGLGSGFGIARRLAHGLQFLLHQALRMAPALLVGLLLLVLSRKGILSAVKQSPARGAAIAAPAPRPVSPSAELFVWGVVPLLGIVLIGLAFGSRLQYHWATPVIAFTLAWLASLVAPRRWQAVSGSTVLKAFALVQSVLLVCSWVSAPLGMGQRFATHMQGFFPAARAAGAIQEPGRQLMGGPIRFVAGEWYLAGALAQHMTPRPLVLIDADHAKSPWIDPTLSRACGILWIQPLPPATPGAAGIPGSLPTLKPGPEAVAPGHAQGVDWYITPPADAAACERRFATLQHPG